MANSASIAWQARVGLAFARSSFLKLLAYRVRYLVGLANYFMYVSVWYYIMRALREANSEALPGFKSSADLVTYFAIAWAARAAYYNNLDSHISQQVSSGQLAMDLIKPSSFPWMKYSEMAGEVVFRLAFMSLPVLLVLAAVYGELLLPPASLGSAALFLFSLVLSFHIYFAINFLTGLVSVVTLKIQGFLWAKFLTVQLLSGVVLPLTLFPAWAQPILTRTPFAGLGHTPVMLYRGVMTGEAAMDALAWQAGWTVFLLLGCRVGWWLVMRRVTIQGG